jgi:hypothetical protein
MPAKCEELWNTLALPGRPGETLTDADEPQFRAPVYAGRALGPVQSLFPRIESPAAKA